MPCEFEPVVAGRILGAEWARRSGPPEGDGWEAGLDGLPPLSCLGARIFPSWVLDRRLRFLAALGDSPAPGLTVTSMDPSPMTTPGPSAEDYAAWVWGSASVDTEDRFLAGLARSLGRPCRGPDFPSDAVAILDRFFESLSGPPQRCFNATVPPAYSRLEAVTVTADRYFGRRGAANRWEHLFHIVGRAGDLKRRVRS